ncbi:MAG: hypothetical protein ACOX1V_04625 [Candidatus Iainarchaeum sp.]|jgi:hypothetical protein
METSALAPIIDKNSTKALIVQVLSEKPLLTLKELHAQLEKQKQLSYQATHKAVNEMIIEGILLKRDDKKYEINKAWATQLEEIAKLLQKNSKSKDYVQIYVYETFEKFVTGIIRLVHDAPNPKKLPGVCITKHAWPPIGLSKQDYELLLELLTQTEYYDISTKDTPLGKAFAKTLEKMGKNVIVGSKITSPLDFICTGNDVFEVVFEESVQKELDRIFNQYKTLDENAINDVLQNIITKPTQIKIIHTNSENYAQKLRKKILKEFEKK